MSLSKFKTVYFPAGHVIFRDKDPRQFLYIIKSGQIEIFKLDSKGLKIPLGIVASGEYLGELGMINELANHSTSAMALTEIEAIQISSETVQEQLKAAPSWLVALTKGLGVKLQHVNEILRRNGLIDDSLGTAVTTAAQNLEKRKK